jgi:proline iminopeptidase
MSQDFHPQQPSGAIAVDGADLRYVIQGSGIPCLVIGSSVYYPRTFSLALREHFRFIFVDLRGFTASAPSLDINQLTIDTFANDVE